MDVEIIVTGSIKLPSPLLSKKMMARVGVKTIAIIKTRTQKGVDHRGKAFEPYSTAAALMPIDQSMTGGNTARMRAFYRKSQKWTRKTRGASTANWVWVPGGYKQYREIQGRNPNKVDLIFTGQMMRNMRLKRVRRDRVLIGFTGASARLAYYHHVAGAGKGRVRREFFTVTRAKELRILGKTLAEDIRKRLKR